MTDPMVIPRILDTSVSRRTGNKTDGFWLDVLIRPSTPRTTSADVTFSHTLLLCPAGRCWLAAGGSRCRPGRPVTVLATRPPWYGHRARSPVRSGSGPPTRLDAAASGRRRRAGPAR